MLSVRGPLISYAILWRTIFLVPIQQPNRRLNSLKKPSNAPKTRLQLTLHGVVASSNPAKALAVIGNRGKQNTYGLDETIEGTRATLAAVYPDRVIIRNAGREETLLFDPNAKPSRSQSQAGNPRVQKPRAKSANASERLEQIRQEVVDNPAALMTYIRLSQVKRDGKVVGYRVNPGKDRALFDSVGLEPNDLAVTLNGVDLTNDAEAAKLWPQLTQMTELNLVVDRQGQRHDIYIGF